MKKICKVAATVVMCAAMAVSMAGCGEQESKKHSLKDNSATEDAEYTYDGTVLSPDCMKKFKSIEDIINEQFYFETTDEDMQEGVYRGLIDSLGDDYAKYYTAEEYAKLLEDNSGEFAGIGVSVRQDLETGYALAIQITEDSPAEAAGIKPGDYIVAVGDHDITPEDDLDYIVSLIRGEEGSDVTITVYTPDDDKPRDITLTRANIESPTVSHEMLENGIGYVRISKFIENTDEEFEEAVEDMEAQKMKGLIIDVRSNPGGMLKTVVAICDYILPEGTIVTEEDKNGKVLQSFESDDAQSIDLPMVVITNGESASASEVLTGALKDYKVATVVGENTFGKGIVQTLIPLDDGSAVKLTTAKYFTPNKNDIHGVGIAPDVEVALPEDYTGNDYMGKKDTQYQKAIEVMKDLLK